MRVKRMIAIFLILITGFSLCACGGKTGGYYITDAGLGKRVLAVNCRENDPLLDTLIAALQVREADGTVAGLTKKWFGSDVTELKGNANALTGLEIQPRTLLIGYDASAFPFAGTNAEGEAEGFEIELAESVCELLGWELKCLPIELESASVALAGGNVDCVWGGGDLRSQSGVRSQAYIETEYVFVSSADAPIKRTRALQGKALSFPAFVQTVPGTEELFAALDTAAKLENTAACFAALDAGRCSAVLTDAIAAAYYAE